LTVNKVKQWNKPRVQVLFDPPKGRDRFVDSDVDPRSCQLSKKFPMMMAIKYWRAKPNQTTKEIAIKVAFIVL